MSRFNLRQKPRISYLELDEPDFDEYEFCDKCRDYVYEYCAIHGPLLVVPDDKVSAKRSLPPFVPHAALTIPHVFLHIAPSIIAGAGLGVFSTLTLPRGVRFGPYRGEKTMQVNSNYCWQIYDRNNKPAYALDAADPNKSNWMRYVNCARHSVEQNLVAYQFRGQLYYRTIKTIPRFTELMVFYGSEFAHFLNVDLRRYNTPLALRPRAPTSEPLPKKQRLETNTEPDNTAKQTRTEPKTEEMTHKDCNEITEPSNTKPMDNVNNKLPTKSSKPRNNTQKNITNDKNNKKPKYVFQYNVCAKQYDKKGDLAQHIDSHDETKRDIYFKCKECAYQSVTQCSLERHLKLHDKSRRFVCDVCGYRYMDNAQLQRHLRNVHSDEKIHECGVCGYKTSTIRNLNRHLIIHSGEKPFSCSVCKFKCSTKYGLQIHSLIHTGEKPYSCSECNYKCTQSSHLRRHLRTHSK